MNLFHDWIFIKNIQKDLYGELLYGMEQQRFWQNKNSIEFQTLCYLRKADF